MIQKIKDFGIFESLNIGIFKCLVVAAIIVLPFRPANAQIYKFRQYTAKEGLGLRHNSIYSVAQDKHGFMWFGTGLGLCRYDGIHFTPPNDDNLPSTNVTASFRDNRDVLWFGFDNGLIVKYDGIEFSIADTSINKKIVTQIIQTPKGEILTATQNGGITRIGRKTDRITEGFEDFYINALCFAADDHLLVGSPDGLFLYQFGDNGLKMTLVARDDNLSYLNVKFIKPTAGGNGYWVATEEDGIFYVTVSENHFSSSPLDIPELEDAKVQSLQEDTQGNLWISTFGKGLLRVQLSPEMSVMKTSVYDYSNGLGSVDVKQAFFDKQQNLWVATYDNGVACITNTAFSFFEAETLNSVGNNVTAVYSANGSEYWTAGTGVIIRLADNPQQRITELKHANGVPNEKITALHADHKGDLWIGTEKSGLYKMSKDAKNVARFYSEENSLSNAIQNFIFSDEEIWMATRNGVLVIDMQTGKKIRQYDTNDGDLPYNNIRDIFKDSKNGIWVATNSNSLIDVKNNRKLTPPDNMETEFSAIAEDEQGRIWAGTLGTGVYLFDDTRDTLAVYRFTTEDDELMTNYCYALASDGNGRIWVGHRRGLSSINTQRLTVNTYGADNSSIYGDVNPLAMVLNSSGEMLIGMTDGMMLYDSKTNRQDVVPMLNLSQVLIDDKPYNTHQPLTLPYKRGGYRVRFDFVGLQYSNPASVSYQYLLQEKYENHWTSFSKSNTVTYPRVVNGKFNFWVKACNSDHCTAETMLFSFEVRNPFWLSWWFIFMVVAAIIGLGYVVITMRERNIRKQQEFLENELKARTKEVRRQKEEIEVKNKDITDSINYAQRIQFSVLPSTDTLRERCSGAFIFYLPRDIVSGDFYWFDYFPSTKRLLIVCADSTGHGVPGAFMSLIGTTLIKDIAMRTDVLDPADILYRLDENVQSTLNQNRDSEHATDGMDITVCEINTETYFTRISSAMRPFIIYKNGEQMLCKSSRSSIGGQRLENKLFETTEVQLSKGDTIYMFTDGYTDQFGGPAGKKFKMNRLQNILNDIHQRNMDEQHRVIRENFNLWKGNDKQVDDVLMIGVKL